MKIITSPKLRLEINKTEAKGIRKVYSDMLKLLSSQDNWIQGDYTGTNEKTGSDTYCLIGAAKKIDGKWEDLADAFMLLNPPAGWEFEMPTMWNYRLDIGALADKGETEVIDFNDNGTTKYGDVVRWLKALIKKTDKIIAA